uniref:Uncharacterized protein n=1 Tax=Arundo donax TaxID=35708 RepID=A0A0A9HGI1_ARUDO
MDPSQRNFTQLLNQESPNQYSDGSQNSPPHPNLRFNSH